MEIYGKGGTTSSIDRILFACAVVRIISSAQLSGDDPASASSSCPHLAVWHCPEINPSQGRNRIIPQLQVEQKYPEFVNQEAEQNGLSYEPYSLGHPFTQQPNVCTNIHRRVYLVVEGRLCERRRVRDREVARPPHSPGVHLFVGL